MNGSSYMANENLNIIASSSPINLANIVNTNYSKDSSAISSLDSNADLLKCGSCLTEFLLSDIVIFIQHKTKNCKQLDPCGRNRDKENYLRCNLCSESFGNAYNLLEHVQYSHKIELFKEISSNIGINSNFQDTTNFNNNCNLSSKSMRNKTLSGTFQTTTQLIPNNSSTNIGLNLSKSNTSSKEIFIDVIPSDPTIDFSDKNQSYNITVSSNSSTSSSSLSSSSSNNKLSHSQTINESILKDKQQYNCKQNREIFTKISETTVESSQDVSNANNKNNSNGNNSNFGSDTFNDNTSSSSNDSQNNKDELTIDSQNTAEMLIKDENISNNNDKNKSNMNGQNNCSSSNGSSKRKKSSSSNKQGSSFFCDVCKASFNQKIHLTKHSAKHTGIKPFKCTECNYSTVERSHLKVHVRVHTGEKPFKCTFCEYATAQSSTLKIHKKRHHDNIDESNQKSNTISEKNYESVSGTISSLLSNDASKINQSSSILPPIFSLLPSKKSNNEEKNIKNENKIENDLKDTNNKNEKNLETNSTTSNCMIGQENSDIYKNKKNLPPMKRFKIFHHLNSTHCVDEQENPSIKLESSNNNSNNTISSSNDNSTENKQENNDNKLLGLANIALERETS